MGSTAADDVLTGTTGKGKKNSSKATSAKKPVARKSPAEKKTASKKSASLNRQADGTGTGKPRKKPAAAGGSSSGKPRKQAQPATRTQAQQENAATRAVEETVHTNTAASDTANPAGEDSRSISWMSAQAVSALNAVKASQARKAESLLARVEKPVPGRPAITELPEQTIEDLLEEIPEPVAAIPEVPGMVTPQETTTSSPAAAGDTPTDHKEAFVMQEKPDEQEIPAAEAAGNSTENTATEVPATAAAGASPEAATAAGTEAVIAAQAQQRGLPVRPIVMAVFLVLLAISAYRYWQENRDAFVAAPPAASSYSESVQDADWSDIPQQQPIAVVGTATGEQPGPAAAAPDIAAQPDTMPGDGRASPAAMEPMEPMEPAAVEDAASAAMQPAAGTATPPPPATRAEPEAAEPAAAVASEPPPPEPATVAAPPAPPVQPQPRYGTPGYGYYPQQRNWQQPYYQPAYPPQYPAR